MRQRLTNIFFTKESIQHLSFQIKKEYPGFKSRDFEEMLIDETWAEKKLKQKMTLVARALHHFLPESYVTAVEILKKTAPAIKGFDAMALPEFVGIYGLKDWDISLKALGCFSKYSSGEFAVRPFLIKDSAAVLQEMMKWADDSNPGLRRFASEGCRPRLPWAMSVPALKKDPSLIIPVLEKLKNDESLFVRKSVANNLNDISKDHPELVLDLGSSWFGKNRNTDWIIKKAFRTLLKQGNLKAMRLFGFKDPAKIIVQNLKIKQDSIVTGDIIDFYFDIINQSNSRFKIRLEYIVEFAKANQKKSQKVFQIKESCFSPGTYSITKKHSFKNMSTRKHYSGLHSIIIVVNGLKKTQLQFFIKDSLV
ncbi:MAG: DNA alkylation repair protein [bacterium]|nr:DNA alkylation repair protein [bacterium]